MSYNIRFDTSADGDRAWPNRASEVAGLIRFHAPDVIGVQEALRSQVNDLQVLLPEYSWIGEGREGGDRGEFCPIYFRRERLSLLEQDTFWLSEDPDEPGSIGWDAELPRIVTWARFVDEPSGREFLHFNTHFDHRGNLALVRSADLLISRVRQFGRGRPCIVSGDFIGNDASEVYRLLTESLADAYRHSEVGHYGPSGTFFGGRFEVSNDPGERLDYLFSTGELVVASHAILSDSKLGVHPSDHLPVLADYRFVSR